MNQIYRELIKTSGKAFYVLDVNLMDEENQKNILEQIRMVDKTGPILIYRGYFQLHVSYNLYFVGSSYNSGFDLYEICAYCYRGRDVILEYNSWSEENGFLKKFAFPSSYKGSLNGHTLTSCC